MTKSFVNSLSLCIAPLPPAYHQKRSHTISKTRNHCANVPVNVKDCKNNCKGLQFSLMSIHCVLMCQTCCTLTTGQRGPLQLWPEAPALQPGLCSKITLVTGFSRVVCGLVCTGASNHRSAALHSVNCWNKASVWQVVSFTYGLPNVGSQITQLLSLVVSSLVSLGGVGGFLKL